MQSGKASRYLWFIITKDRQLSFIILHTRLLRYLPTIARLDEERVFLAPDGNFTLVLPASGLCETIVA